MLRGVAILLGVIFTVSGDSIETNIEELILGGQPLPDVVDFSKLDLEMLKNEAKDNGDSQRPPKGRKREHGVPLNKKGRKPRGDSAGGPIKRPKSKLSSSTIAGMGEDKPRGRSGRSKKPRRKKHTRKGKVVPERPGKQRPHRTRPKFSQPALHTFDVTTAEGSTIRLDKENFPDAKAFLIVNTATGSEFTDQWLELEHLWNEYRADGLQIVAFPSNSFSQEPLDDEEIQSFVKDTYKVTFPIMAKCDVTGDKKPALYNWLTEWAGRDGKVPKWAPLEDSGLKRSDVQWDFEKFLVYNRRNDQVVIRYPYDSSPLHLSKYIDRAILVNDGNKIEL